MGGAHQSDLNLTLDVSTRLQVKSSYLQEMYRGREDGGIHQVPTVVGPISCPHTGGERFRVKERYFLNYNNYVGAVT